MEPHFGVPFPQWLPAPTRAQLIHRFRVGYSKPIKDYHKAAMAADDYEMVDRMLVRKLFPDATIHSKRFALMTKSLIAIREG